VVPDLMRQGRGLGVPRLETVNDAKDQERDRSTNRDCKTRHKSAKEDSKKSRRGEGRGYKDTELTDSHTDPPSQRAPPNNSQPSTEHMPRDSAKGNPPIILARGHGDGRDLAAIAPLAQKRHDESLHPGRTEDEAEEVIEACEGRREGRGAGRRGRRGAV